MTKLVLVSMLALSSVSAFAITGDDLYCKSRPGAPVKMTLSATNVRSISGEVGEMSDVVAKVKNSYDENYQTGKARVLKADEKYNPRKYKDTQRFNLGGLKDARNMNYYPDDTCSINVMMPNAATKKNVEVAVVANCSQGGGSMTLDCSLIPTR